MRRLLPLVTLAVVTGCTSADPGPAVAPTPSATTSAPAASTTTPTTPPTTPTTPPTTTPRLRESDPDVATALETVRHLAGQIGPRHGTSPAFRRAAAYVERELVAHGWQVERQPVPTPAGISWGVPVPAGRSVNLIATRDAVEPGQRWLVVGAHLDTVPQAPGAEDNGSGVGALLALAEALDPAIGRRTRLPVVLVAFGSEEPRGPTDDDHHYGSRAYVASLDRAQRSGLRGMVSLDRVGVGDVLPIGSPDASPLRAELVRAARRAGIEVVIESGQRSSDHWSFVRDGLPGVRLGSTPYAAYHSAADTPEVIGRAQLERTLRTLAVWLR